APGGCYYLSLVIYLFCVSLLFFFFFFFFQAEDGIRDFHVTGVQTCALPIFAGAIPKKQRLYNEILKQLFFNKVLSCADLSSRIHKSIPLTTQYLNELIQHKLVVESGYAESTGGRRPLMYS